MLSTSGIPHYGGVWSSCERAEVDVLLVMVLRTYKNGRPSPISLFLQNAESLYALSAEHEPASPPQSSPLPRQLPQFRVDINAMLLPSLPRTRLLCVVVSRN